MIVIYAFFDIACCLINALSNISKGFDHKGRIFSSGRRLDFDLSFGFNFR